MVNYDNGNVDIVVIWFKFRNGDNEYSLDNNLVQKELTERLR
jgi:hypothetical protein